MQVLISTYGPRKRIAISWPVRPSSIDQQALVATLLEDRSVPDDVCFVISPTGRADTEAAAEMTRIASTIDQLRCRFNGRFAVLCDCEAKRWFCKVIVASIDRGQGKTKLFGTLAEADRWLSQES